MSKFFSIFALANENDHDKILAANSMIMISISGTAVMID